VAKHFVFFLFFNGFFLTSISAQSVDSNLLRKDSLPKIITAAPFAAYDSVLNVTLNKSNFFKSTQTAVAYTTITKKTNSVTKLFYIIVAVLLCLAFLNLFYNKYFSNLFKVFFNTSLRQSQLSDQLLQAKVPSLFFNLFFIFSATIYVYLLLVNFGLASQLHIWYFLGAASACLGTVYSVKFLSLKFTGWITGFKAETNTYLFIIFLLNKILGVFLLPFTIIIAFSDKALVNIVFPISLVIIILMYLLRFVKSYGLLQNQLKISGFHFLLYSIGVEILPLLLIYKGLMVLLTKNL
jgi:Domain of unknown function (DUF4271)